MRLSIVIVNYNVRHFLEQALYSVYKAKQELECEIFVVDNNSVDISCEMVKEKFPDCIVIENKENVGFAKANNQAIRVSKGEYVLLLNPDTVLQEDTLKSTLAFMDAHPDAGGLGVRMIDGKGKFLPESKRGLPTPLVAFYKMTGLSSLFPHSRIFGKYHLGYLKENEIHAVEVLSGAFMLLRKKALDAVGLLDEAFFMYGEDVDLSYRLTLGGYTNYYFPDTTIIHFKGESTKKKSANYVKVFYNAMILFARKHYSSKMAGLFAFFISLAIQLRAGLSFLFRFMEALFAPILDFIFIYIGYFGITRYWEQYHKDVHGFYPLEYYSIHIPVYIIVGLASIYFSGGYDKPLVLRRLIRGSVFGSVMLFAMYAFLPKNLQFSRAILGLGCAWSVAAPFLIRVLRHYISRGKYSIAGLAQNRIAIVANPVEAKRIKGVLAESNVLHEFIGYISPSKERPDNFVGTLDQLDEVIAIFKVNLIIFSAADVSSAEMMQVMSAHASAPVHFKIVAENSLAVIGSDSKNIPGELFTIDVHFSIAHRESLRKRRVFDLSIVVLAVVFIWLLIFRKNGRKMLAYLWPVVLGKKTWVSYMDSMAAEGLPRIKDGLISPKVAFSSNSQEANIYLAYARDYHVQKDFNAVLRYLFS